MANLADELRREKVDSVNFQDYLDYVAEKIRHGNDGVWFGRPWNDNCKGVQYYKDVNLAESLVLKFRSEGFKVDELRSSGFNRLLQFEVHL